MKIAIIGAAGVRTPLIVQAMLKRQDRLGLSELALMDIDGERLELIGALTTPIEHDFGARFHISRTTDARLALAGADFVITTFRVGGIESRVIDERVPLNHGILGQETTGPGGFAMGIRSIPVLIDYTRLMQELCPEAWLINFANPAGMLTEAVIRNAGSKRVVGICDGPTSMHRLIAVALKAQPEEVRLDYFGLNHLGWIKAVYYKNQDRLPELIKLIKAMGSSPGLPFEVDFIESLAMIPNEYLYYYYDNAQAVKHILAASECRGEQVARENIKLFAQLKKKFDDRDFEGMQAMYQAYLDRRNSTYMVTETGKSLDFSILRPNVTESSIDEGYARVALNLIEALRGDQPRIQILNVANRGAMPWMEDDDVVEIPTLVSHNRLQPMITGEAPSHCIGLIQQVKQYEHLTIEAAIEKSYSKALLALAIHPLVRDYSIARSILDEYIAKHQAYFPVLH